MEKVKEILLTAGKTALNSAVELGRSVVQLAARLGGTAASFVGKKTCALAKEHRQPLTRSAISQPRKMTSSSGWGVWTWRRSFTGRPVARPSRRAYSAV